MFKSILFTLVGMLFTLVFFGLFFFIFVNSNLMVCNRQADGTLACLIEKRFMDRIPVSSRLVKGVTGAQVADSCDSDGCAYRMELVTADGDSQPFDDVYSDRGPANQYTSQVNQFIKQGDSKTLTIQQPVQLWVVLLLAGLGLLFLGIEAFAMIGQVVRGMTGRR